MNNRASMIADGALYGCESLINITIPLSVKSIGNKAFYECKSLTDVRYYGTSDPGSDSIEVFGSCNKLKYVTVFEDIYEDGMFCGKEVAYYCGKGTSWNSYHRECSYCSNGCKECSFNDNGEETCKQCKEGYNLNGNTNKCEEIVVQSSEAPSKQSSETPSKQSSETPSKQSSEAQQKQSSEAPRNSSENSAKGYIILALIFILSLVL